MMKKLLKILSILTLTSCGTISVVACKGPSSSSDKTKAINQKIIENLANIDYSVDVVVNNKAADIINDINGEFFAKYIFDNLKEYYQPSLFKVISIVKKADNQPLKDQDFTKLNPDGLKTIVSFTYNSMAGRHQLNLTIKVDQSVDDKISDVLTKYHGYKIKVEQGISVEAIIEKIKTSNMFAIALEQDPTLLNNFDVKKIVISNLTDSNGEPFGTEESETYPFYEGNPDLKAQFTFKYSTANESVAHLTIIVLYNDTDKQEAISQCQDYTVTFDRIKNGQRNIKAIRQIFNQLTANYIISKLPNYFQAQMDVNKIKIDSSRIFISFDRKQVREVEADFFSNLSPGGFPSAQILILWAYNKNLPGDHGPFQQSDFITVRWKKEKI